MTKATSNSSKSESQDSADLIDTAAHKRNIQAAQDALVAEFYTLMSDTEKLLKKTGDAAGSQAEELREKVTEKLDQARSLLKETEDSLREHGAIAVQRTEDYVQAKPLQAVGIAAGIGFLFGLLVARR